MGTQLPFPKRDSPQFLAHVCCGQTAGWNKMPLDREVGRGPGHIVLDGDPAPLPQKGRSHQIFGPRLQLPAELTHSPQKGGHSRPHFFAHVLWPNGWMDQDATWFGGRPRPWPHCVRWGLLPPKEHPPIFGPCLLWPNGWMDQGSRCHLAGR